MRADLHTHTTASDGKLEPAEIIKLAIDVGLDVIAITDHDTVDGIAPALEAALEYPSLTVIPGIEINTDVPHGEVHVLGYFIDYTDEDLIDALQELRESRQGRAIKMIDKLQSMGLTISKQRVYELASGGIVARPHVAQAMLEAGYIKSRQEAFDKYIGHEGPAYVNRKKMLPVEAVELVISAHGLPVLAHPADINSLDILVGDLKEAGLVGIEAYYDGYSKTDIENLLEIAKKYKLITTGGTDYHAFGDGQESMLGSTIPPAQSVMQLLSFSDKA